MCCGSLTPKPRTPNLGDVGSTPTHFATIVCAVSTQTFNPKAQFNTGLFHL
jgi:hypothetical protein